MEARKRLEPIGEGSGGRDQLADLGEIRLLDVEVRGELDDPLHPAHELVLPGPGEVLHRVVRVVGGPGSGGTVTGRD